MDGVKRIKGRVDDIIIGKDGSLLTRVDFIEEGNHIKACQWIQEDKGKLLILIVPDKGFSPQDKNYVIEETLKRIGKDNVDLETQIVGIEQLYYTKRGKFQLIVNKINK